MVKEKKKEKVNEKEEICEVFDVKKKGGKTEEKRVCDLVEKKHASKAELAQQNKILRNILIGIGVFILIILLGVSFIKSAGEFKYRGLDFKIVKEGKLIFYQTSFPVYYNGQIVPYNIYIRNDPRKIHDIPFNGEIIIGENLTIFDDEMVRLVLNSEDEFNCEGDGIISIANLMNLKAIGVKIVKDENASCDEQGRYIYVNIQKSENSEINEIGPVCYDLNVKDCDILKVTERFLVETLVQYNALKN